MTITRPILTAGLALAMLAGAAAQQVRDGAAPPSRTGKASLSGIVVSDEQTPQPVRRASVLVQPGDGTPPRTVFTDESGRFSVTGLTGGRYNLSASKPPFLDARFGSRRPDSPGTAITLKDTDQMTDITLRMSRGAVLTGRITDENGEPAFGVQVRALQMRNQFGERTFVPVATINGLAADSTDDRGTFRFYGLPPGEYAITAMPPVTPGEVKAMTDSEVRAIMLALQQQKQAQQQAANNPSGPRPTPTPTPTPDPDKVTVAYAPIYYPGVLVSTSATTVTVAAGEERSGLDFALKLVRTTTVEGMVVVPQGVSPQSVQLMMTPTTPDAGAGGLAGLELLAQQRVTPGPDGRFRYTSIAPGQYTIAARATRPNPGAAPANVPPPPPPPPPPPGGAGAATFTRAVVMTGGAGGTFDASVLPEFISLGPPADPNATQYWANADISVDGSPVNGVTLTLQPGMTVSGRVEFKSGVVRPNPDLTRGMINLMPAPTGGGVRLSLGTTMSAVSGTGQFTIKGVVPGRYRLSGNMPPPPGSGPGTGWTILSAVAKGQDLMDFPLAIGPNEDVNDVVVTFTDVRQQVSGSLIDGQGRPAPDYTIVVFAADRRFWTPGNRRVRSARPATDGKFTVANLPPGEYLMAAVTDMSPNDLNDPGFLQQLLGASFKITLGFGENKVQDLKISGGL